ncbi:MAG TPA: CoA pyrophosphatase [Chitinophagales bacterium]|nr:CoA pyrophosphatase [Chitinophagales bacterium]
MFHEVIRALESQLSKPLPGKNAQEKMRPYLPLAPSLDLPKIMRPKESAVMALLYPKYDIPHLLLIERNIYRGPHSGQISLPGGKLDRNETYTDAAIRETKEEVDVDKHAYNIIGELSKLYVPASNFNIQPFVSVADRAPILHPNEREVAKILETPLSYFFERERRKEKLMKSSMGIDLMAPYFDIHDRALWGATAMILSELIEIIQESPQNIIKY